MIGYEGCYILEKRGSSLPPFPAVSSCATEPPSRSTQQSADNKTRLLLCSPGTQMCGKPRDRHSPDVNVGGWHSHRSGCPLQSCRLVPHNSVRDLGAAVQELSPCFDPKENLHLRVSTRFQLPLSAIIASFGNNNPPHDSTGASLVRGNAKTVMLQQTSKRHKEYLVCFLFSLPA